MRFAKTPLPGAWLIELDLLGDERGWFARTFDVDEFARRGLDPTVVQCNASFNAKRDTLRGMHLQSRTPWRVAACSVRQRLYLRCSGGPTKRFSDVLSVARCRAKRRESP